MRILILTFAWTTLLVAAASAATWHVPADAPSIKAGLDLAAAGDVVEVACGTYYEHDLVMPGGVTLRSATGDPACVTIDAQQLGRVILCNHVDGFRLEGLTVTGGNVGEAEGGGVSCLYATGDLAACRFTGNLAGHGGGAYLTHSPLTITDCRFDANSASYGGGLACYWGDPIIVGSEFSANLVIDGGGIYLARSSAHLTGCLFFGNDAMFWGGGVLCTSHGAPVFEGCTMARNDAYEGSGLWAVDECAVVLRSTLVAFNTHGNGVHMYDDLAHPSSVDLDCCDVFGNTPHNYGGLAVDQTGEDGNVSADPLFCDAAAGDFTLDAVSPCVPAHNECGVQIGALGVGCGLTPAPAGPAALVLHPCYPNPFNPCTTLTFTLPADGTVRLEIYAMDGTRVATLLDEARPAGTYTVAWHGRDDQGRDAPAGIYAARLVTAGAATGQRLALVR
jgi:hypothetical protein